MAKQAMRHGRQWVWLPAEAPVRKKGATHWLKPGVWYQAKIDGDGNRVFYDKQGKLVGRTRDEVQVKIGHGGEGLGRGGRGAPADPAGRRDDRLGDKQPATPPPAERPSTGRSWVYVTLPTQTYTTERDP